MRKKKTAKRTELSEDRTLYYRATYITTEGNREQEVFISDSLDTARAYATGPNARGRQLTDVEEFKQFIDSLL